LVRLAASHCVAFSPDDQCSQYISTLPFSILKKKFYTDLENQLNISDSEVSETMSDVEIDFERLLDEEDTIYLYDISKLKNLYTNWIQHLSYITPYYAVKCNPDIEILKCLSECGANFDCASPSEIRAVLELGVSPDRIIYANPCKRLQDIRYAYDNGVTITTFDNLCELEKLYHTTPNMNLILRIYANDPTARCVLSNKFGAFRNEWEILLQRARELEMNIIGISFHIGSGACNPEAFRDAISQVHTLYTIGKELYGYEMNIIDIGGGFSYDNIPAMSKSIHYAIEKYFPKEDYPQLTYMAEPGRYFAETIAILFTKIIGIRERDDTIDYWITDSLYGSFNCILYDHIHLHPHPLKHTQNLEMKSVLWGPTCDGFDKIGDTHILPKMSCGDWIEWKNMGAYTIAGATDFNGILLTQPKKLYIY
jgi:ornithine decarboxylase